MDNEARATALRSYGHILEMLASKLLEGGDPEPGHTYTWRHLECGHIWRLEREDPAICPACERWRGDVEDSLRQGDSVNFWSRRGLPDPLVE